MRDQLSDYSSMFPKIANPIAQPHLRDRNANQNGSGEPIEDFFENRVLCSQCKLLM
jgi:hypothetical protein